MNRLQVLYIITIIQIIMLTGMIILGGATGAAIGGGADAGFTSSMWMLFALSGPAVWLWFQWFVSRHYDKYQI